MRWMMFGCILALSTTALAASRDDARERKLDEQYRRCVQACRKPSPRQETDEKIWMRNIQEEARYDNCIHNCDRMQLRGFRK